nr:hypothetical protein [Tanacetum cinerariifolium]
GKRMRLVTHGLEGYEFENTCNNGKNLSEIQLEHEKEDELVVVVVKVVHESRHWMVKKIENELLEEVDVSYVRRKVYSFGEIGVQEWTFMRRVLTDSREDIGQGDVLRRRRRVGMK